MKDMQKMNKKTGVLLGISIGASALIAAACSGDSKSNNPPVITQPTTTTSGTDTTAPPVPPGTDTATPPAPTTPAPTTPGTVPPTTPPAAEPSACTSVDYEAGNDAFTSASLSGTRSVYGYGDNTTSLCKTADDPVAPGAVCVEGNAVPAGTDFATWGAGIGLLLAATDANGEVISAWDAAALNIAAVRFTAAGLEGTRKVRIGITQVDDPAITETSKNYGANGFLSGGTSAKPLIAGVNEIPLANFKLPSWAKTAIEEGLGAALPEGGDTLDPSKIHSMQLQVANNPNDDEEKYKFCISNLEWLDAAGNVVQVVVEDPGVDTGSDTGAVDSSAPAPSGSAGGDSSAPPDDTAEPVTFASVSAIFSAKCVTCHGGGAMNLSDEASASAKATDIVSRVTNPDPNQRMPRNGDALPAEDIATIQAWAASL